MPVARDHAVARLSGDGERRQREQVAREPVAGGGLMAQDLGECVGALKVTHAVVRGQHEPGRALRVVGKGVFVLRTAA